MKSISKYFLRGLFTFLPFGLTIYLFVSFILWSEKIATKALEPLVGIENVPGLGLVLAISLICLLGFIVSQPFFKGFFGFIELPFKNVPIIKSVYLALKNFADFFSTSSRQGNQQVVLVKMPGQEMELVGFQTRSHLDDLPNGVTKEDRICVFFPLSYQIGGYSVFIPRKWATPIDMPVEEAMRLSLTGWMS